MVEKTSENNEIKVILYWAEWCHFCTEFKPIWEQLIKEVEKNEKLSKFVKFEDYEETANKEFIEEKGIRGFPTIHINEEPYNGQRTVLNIIKAIEDKINKKQTGGEINQDNYFYKYLKYKIKYYNLKKLQ